MVTTLKRTLADTTRVYYVDIADATTAQEIVPAIVGKRTRIIGGSLQIAGAALVEVEDAAGGWLRAYPIDALASLSLSEDDELTTPDVNEAINIKTDTVVRIRGSINVLLI